MWSLTRNGLPAKLCVGRVVKDRSSVYRCHTRRLLMDQLLDAVVGAGCLRTDAIADADAD